MIVFQANDSMRAIYTKTISVMEQNVEWNGTFMISNNTLILPGTLKSLFFNFDDKRAMGGVVEGEVKNNILDMKGNQTLESAINMLLYVFGKWGKIKGLLVDKNYHQLTHMINGIFADINVTVTLTSAYCHFYHDGMQLTYEETMEKLYDYLFPKKEDESEDENSDEESDENGNDKKKNSDNEASDEISRMGLWHKLVWKSISAQLQKTDIDAKDRKSKRIGKGFYLTNYVCNSCRTPMYMVVYSKESEFTIDTDKGQVITTRNYTCPGCYKFFTPLPFKTLSDNEVFIMDFEEDEGAYDDYFELIGSDGERAMNCGFNRFVDEKLNKEYNQDDLPEPRRGRRYYKLYEEEENLDSLSDDDFVEAMELCDEGMMPEELDESDIENFEAEVERQKKNRGISYKKLAKKQKKETKREKRRESKKDKESVRDVIGENRLDKITTEKNSTGENAGGENIAKNNKAEITNGGKNAEKIMGESVYSEKNSSDKGGKESQRGKFISRRSKVAVAKKIIESGDINTFQKYLGSMEEEDLDEFIRDVGSSLSGVDEENTSPEKIKNAGKKKEFVEAATNKLMIIQQKNILDMAVAAKQKSYQEIKTIFEALTNKQWLPSLAELKGQVLDNLKKCMQTRGEQELAALVSHIPENMTKEHYKQYKKKILEYENIDKEKYLEELENKLDKSENAAIKELISKYSKSMGNRSMLTTLMDKIKNGGYKKSNSQPYLEELNHKLRELDEILLSRLVPDVMTLDFDEGMQLYGKINAGPFLPELKKEFLTKINKRLASLKKEECRSLVNKLIKDTGLAGEQIDGIYTYDVKKMENIENQDDDAIVINNAINTYVDCDEYEYPLLIYDSTKNDNGEKGFVLTPDKIFYNMGMNSGFVYISDINGIYTEGGLFAKGIYVKYINGQVMKICGNIKDKDKFGRFAARLTGFIQYLKEKPQSRNVDYLSKEKHEKKCCYRCGFMYTEGNVCPKCGGRNK